MQVTLEAIKFNHDPNSAIADALNVRRNETQFINVPEWRRGVTLRAEDSVAAYAFNKKQGNITIQAKFRSLEPRVKRIEIRAIDPMKDLVVGATIDRLALVGASVSSSGIDTENVLGEVKSRQVNFKKNGETDFEIFELPHTKIGTPRVRVGTTTWLWQYRINPTDRWIDICTTHHKIYTTLGMPSCPWAQQPYDPRNVQLPWAEVLDYACAWANGAQNLDEAARRITEFVFGLGSNLVHYDPASSYADLSFDCASFLDLLQDDKGMGQTLNCEDCATLVSTFANILGCDLSQSRMGYDFDTNPIKLIGASTWEPVGFSYHEVAWKGKCKKDDELFDGCVALDGDEDPTKYPHHSMLASHLAFGDSSQEQYRFRIAPPPEDEEEDACVPRPITRQRRLIGLGTRGKSFPLDKQRFKELKATFAMDAYPLNVSATSLTSLSRKLHDDQTELAGWRLYRIRYLDNERFDLAFHSLWFIPEGDQEMLIRVDVYQLKSSAGARDELLRLLSRFQILDLTRQDPSLVGEVSFTNSPRRTLFFTWNNCVVEVRSVGRKRIDPLQLAQTFYPFMAGSG